MSTPFDIQLPTPAQDMPEGRQWLELSLAQRPVWLDVSLSTISSAYTLVRWVRIQGQIDVLLASQALDLVIARHDALRLRVDRDLPRQWLAISANSPFVVSDLSSLNLPEVALQTHVEAILSKGMPLGDNPLFSFELIKLGAADYYILMRCHHLLADEAAVSMILQHWLGAYSALTSNTAAELAHSSSYLSIIDSDLAYEQSTRYKEDLSYWTGRFKSLPEPLFQPHSSALGLSQAKPTNTSWTLDGDLYKAFQASMQTASVTAHRLVFALFSAVLGRRYGRADIVIGMALHRRDASNLHVIGMLAGMIAVRQQLDRQVSLLETIQQVSAQIDRNLRHQRLPVDAISRALAISRAGLGDLFQVAFSFLPAERGTADTGLADSSFTIGSIASSEASPLTFHARELKSGLGITFDLAAQPSFVSSQEAERIMLLFREALAQFVEDSSVELETLPGITNAERELVIRGWNQTAATYPIGTIDHFFEQQARQTPDALAVIDAKESLSYRELDARSKQLAHFLIDKGLRPQCVVGVAMERSVGTVVSILAILKAGFTYLPLDVTYPPDRVSYMVADSGAQFVITDSLIGNLLAETPLVKTHRPNDTAYIIYTSGSTGKPKGVTVPHSAAVNLAFGRLQHDPISIGDRILASVSVGFDVSIGQLLLPLLSGATVVIADDLRSLSATEFWSFLQLHRVSHVNSVPSFFESIVDAAPVNCSLIRLMLGGEPLSSALVRRLQQVLPTTEVINMYGPTEACIDATFYAASNFNTVAVLPIGKPLPNYRAYILDEFLEPVGIGIAGDLYLAGAGLAHAYINQAALTAERFIADPFATIPGERLYNTGDHACWREDGNIEFQGRADTQVKIRGHRIELGEIEAALLIHPDVAQAVVVANTEKAGPSRLVAYVVLHSASAVTDATRLRAHLATHVPEYMIPTAFATLAVLPLTSNGKLDHRALPAVSFDSSAEYVAPRNSTEQSVTEIFLELLPAKRIGALDNFFELGGHSLLATRLVSQLAARLNITIPLRTVFECPTVEALASYIQHSGSATATAMTPFLRPDHLPLAFTQERLWFLSQLQRDDSYNVPVAVRFRGRLNVGLAVSALQQLVARHEALRSNIVMIDGLPVQRILDPTRIQLETIYLDNDLVAAHERLKRLAHGYFDLATDLPLKLELISLTPDDHILAAVVHHAFFDGWSVALFFREFGQLYTDAASALPPLRFQFAEFALWQRQQSFQEDLAFWKQTLLSAPRVLEFPTDYSPAPTRSIKSGIQAINFDRRLHESLQSVANASGASLFMLLHAAFASLLSRWSGQNDVVIGTVVSSRSKPEFEQIIGCLVNTLALRTTLRPFETFVELLAKIREDDLAAYEHQGVPFEQVVDALQPERSLDLTPLFQAMLVLQNNPLPDITVGGLHMEPLPFDPGVAKFNLTLNLGPDSRDGSLVGSLEYAADLYESSTMEQFAKHFERLLQSVAINPQQVTMQMDLLAPDEQKQILQYWNSTTKNYPQGTADQFFARQVFKTPEALAVVSNTESLTYLELDGRSNQLAYLILARGLRPQAVVGVALERSVATVVSLLAILKAGCIYLPLDPSYPAERLAHMLSDSNAQLVITDAASPAIHVEQLLFEANTERRAEPPISRHQSNDTAYVIYTSGSTGKPKGVAVPHSAAVNLAFARLTHDPIGPGDRILAAISVGFDVSIGQLLLPLLSGATVVIAGDLRSLSALDFWEFLQTHQITHVNSVPSFFESVLRDAPKSSFLTRLMLGGEALSGALVQRLRQALPTTQIVNMYGPTEACIDATCYIPSPEDTSGLLPIGKPLPNYAAYILDKFLNPVSVGVIGDLYLSGAGLAHAYINQPALTAERFIANPFASRPGQRLYKTGDRGRWRTDGNIEFLGRADKQIKLRGHRIEVGEIEAALKLQPHIEEAVVVLREDSLIAYYVAAEQLQSETLRTSLAMMLPHYMLPAAYLRIEAVPLTVNGKLDHNALPAPNANADGTQLFIAPEGDAEEKIASVFADVLKLDQVSRQDNFFELGGHSLLAMTVIERLRQADLHIDVRALFKSPTVAGLASSLTATTEELKIPVNGIEASSTSITPEMLPLLHLTQREIDSICAQVPGGAGNVQDIYPLVPLQEGILFHHLMATSGDAYLTPFLLEFDRRERLELFLNALKDLISRHDILRTSILWDGLSQAVQVVLREAPLGVQEVTLSEGDAPSQLRELYNPRHFRIDVREAPMLRAYVARDSASDRWLLLLMSHHLILDHSSLDVILREVQLISSGHREALPEPVPFRNFVAQGQLGIQPAEHEAFFHQLLGDVSETTAPYGLVQIEGNGAGIREARAIVSPATASRLRTQARAMGVGPATLFHLAWGMVLAHISGRRDVVFGTLLFGRMQSGEGMNRALGLFINTVPMRLKIDRTPVASAVRTTHDLLATLIRHEHASLALAQRCSGVTAPAPLFSSLFNFRHSPAAQPGEDAANWPGVELLFVEERTDYPVALAVDDRTNDFLLTAQADHPVDPNDLCRYMQTALDKLLHGLDKEPQIPIVALSVLSSEDVSLRFGRTNAEACFPTGTLHELFEAQANRTPNEIAVVYQDECLTYAELDLQSEKLACGLVASGIGLQDVVGVALPRSTATVVSFLAILKAGAVYLPLDPAYPADRRDHMITDSAARLVITEGNYELLKALEGRVSAKVHPGHTAYIIYTSGSTGQPKGVAVPHSAATNLAFARLLHDPISTGDRVLAAISVGFDVSIGQLMLPLLNGAMVVIADDLRSFTAQNFWDFIQAHKVTHINSVPSFFDSILEAAPNDCSLVRLMLGGEGLSAKLVQRLQKALPGTELVNMYGPTEACIDATSYTVTESESASVLPIGKPIPNYQTYILNDALQPCGVGVAGDLYLAGAGLAHCYINQPALTAERFIANPFSMTGARMYQTGDRACWRPGGSIDFLGRVDTQVKIRGHRIELGEIEAALLLHPAIHRAAVITDSASSTRLIAYVVVREGQAVETADLREHLRLQLPEYMLPAAYCTLDALPLTRNGKLDVKALPKVLLERSSETAYEPPTSQTEVAMQQLWQGVLEVQPIGIHDDFFALGGHSLAVMRLINACNMHFRGNLSLRSLFEHPTIAQLSAAIDTNATVNHHPCVIPLRSSGTKRPLFCIHPAGGAVLRYAPLTAALNADQPVYGLQARGLLEGQPLGASMEEMAADYVLAIQSVQPVGPYQMLGWSSGGMLAFEIAQQFHRAGERVSFVGLFDTSLPDPTKKNPTESELMQAFAVTFGYDDLLRERKPPKSREEFLERVQSAGRLPQGSEFDQFTRFYAVFCNSVRIYPEYEPKLWSGPFVLFRALQRSSPMPDWSTIVPSGAQHIDLDCTHADFATEGLAPTLAKHIEQLLEEGSYGTKH